MKTFVEKKNQLLTKHEIYSKSQMHPHTPYKYIPMSAHPFPNPGTSLLKNITIIYHEVPSTIT